MLSVVGYWWAIGARPVIARVTLSKAAPLDKFYSVTRHTSDHNIELSIEIAILE